VAQAPPKPNQAGGRNEARSKYLLPSTRLFRPIAELPFANCLFIKELSCCPPWGGFDLPNYQITHLPNQPKIYLLVNTSPTPPHISHLIPGWRRFTPLLPLAQSQLSLASGHCAFYYLINRVMLHLSVFLRVNKVRKWPTNYFAPAAFFFAILYFHPPHIWRCQEQTGCVFRPWP